MQPYANNAFFASSSGIAANKSSPRDPLVLVGNRTQQVDMSRIHDRHPSFFHVIDPCRRGQSLACFRRRFLPRTKLEHPQRLGPVVHLLLPTLSDLLRFLLRLSIPERVSLLCPPLNLLLVHFNSTSSTTSSVSTNCFFASVLCSVIRYFTIFRNMLSSSASIVFRLFPSVLVHFPSSRSGSS